MRSKVAPAFVLSAFVLLAPAAGASPTFPPAIKNLWGVSRFPAAAGREGCLLCHATEAGGVVGTPFGSTAKARGAAGNNDLTSLSRALNAIRSSGVDSDADDISDYQEIARDRSDPNDPDDFVVPEPSAGGAGGEQGYAGANASGGVGLSQPPEEIPNLGEVPPLPQHGCAVSSSRPNDIRLTPVFVFVFALALAGRRRTCRRSDTESQRERVENVSCADLCAPVHSRR